MSILGSCNIRGSISGGKAALGHPANFSLCCVLPDSIPAAQILSMTKPDKLKIWVTNMVTLVCGIIHVFLGGQEIWDTIRAWS